MLTRLTLPQNHTTTLLRHTRTIADTRHTYTYQGSSRTLGDHRQLKAETEGENP